MRTVPATPNLRFPLPISRHAALHAPRILCLALAVVVLPLLASCASQPLSGSVDALHEADMQAAAYRLDSGDKVQITVFGEGTISGEYVVNFDGTIALPLAGNIKAAGLTIPELQNTVTETLRSGYVQEARVTVQPVQLRPYYILGEVNKPGKYSYAPDLSVLGAVAEAQGFTYRANMSVIYIRRAQEPSERALPLTATTMVRPGDTIRVTERFF